MLNDTINLLSLESYKELIETIDVIHLANDLECHILLKRQQLSCPLCGSNHLIIHSKKTRRITHSINTRGNCTLVIKYHLLQCKKCLKTISEKIPITEHKQQISTYTKMRVLSELRDPTKTFTATAKQFGITTQTVVNVFDQFVNPPRLNLPAFICMDEFYLGKRSKNKYACVLLDFEKKRIIEVYETRHKFKLADLFFKIPLQERTPVKAVIIDMWVPYKDVINRCFPNAVIAVDSFHVIWHLNKAMTNIRIRIMNKYRKNVSNLIANDMYYYMLKKFHFFFLVDYEKLGRKYTIPKLKTYYTKDYLLSYLLSIDDELKQAYLLKESYRNFNKTADYNTCAEQLDDLIHQFRNNQSEEMIAITKMLNSWRTEIKNSFICVDDRRLSNGPIESMNSRIKTIMKSSNGYKDFSRLRNRIIYSLNKNTSIRG